MVGSLTSSRIQARSVAHSSAGEHGAWRQLLTMWGSQRDRVSETKPASSVRADHGRNREGCGWCVATAKESPVTRMQPRAAPHRSSGY